MASLAGGTNGLGAIFKLSAAGSITLLHSFNGHDGDAFWRVPDHLIETQHGDFYGTTRFGGPQFNGVICNNAYGTIFKITADGTLTTLVAFNGTNGFAPTGLAQDVDGAFYGTTDEGGIGFGGASRTCGGSGGFGTLFKLDTNGLLTSLFLFNRTNGANPRQPLIRGSDGNFYGITYTGGASNLGTVFRVTPSGDLTTLASFYGTNGAYPLAALLQASDGNFYGTTYNGGVSNLGTIFRLTVPPPPPKLSLVPDGSGGYFIRVQGTPNLTYRLQRAPNLTVPWSTSAAQTAPASGQLEFHDLFPPTDRAFYRTVQE